MGAGIREAWLSITRKHGDYRFFTSFAAGLLYYQLVFSMFSLMLRTQGVTSQSRESGYSRLWGVTAPSLQVHWKLSKRESPSAVK
ncbi:hypothetical protein EJ02DRAFT_265993 [Clathrospora elynae]|uniref:Uncharacterized protein n=1 Tax=Clathrospora elynae TaxID=706981 RepID=A0A6A5SH67_9PLEO|nr:hypothetical protein EJ02DRAFT_265993 [Clathrospora elynae]